jgi:hypothetical protein
MLHGYKSLFGTGTYFSGKISFKKGNTEGIQEFEGTSMDDLYTKMAEFVNSLE